jgi:hypothetical protein
VQAMSADALVAEKARALAPMTVPMKILLSDVIDVCWRMHRAYEYPPEAHVIIHPNHWHWGAGDHYAWREHSAAAIGLAMIGSISESSRAALASAGRRSDASFQPPAFWKRYRCRHFLILRMPGQSFSSYRSRLWPTTRRGLLRLSLR